MEEDLISQLPDDILLLILDKMNIYEAFQTTFLSKRWNNLWRSLPRLHFHLNSPPLYVFTYNVSDLLSHRDDAAPVHDFLLSFDPYYSRVVDGEFVKKCVAYAINHGVQSLRLDAPTYLELPAAFFSCKTLRELELRNLGAPLKVPGCLSLPNLKTLLIQNTSLAFDDDDVRKEPFSGLPKLEKLTLDEYSRYGLVIKAPKLRVLKIINYDAVEEISAPLLTSFRYDNYIAWERAKVDLPMLEQVHLDIQSTRYDFNHVHTDFVRMLHQFRNVTTVSLTSNTLKVPLSLSPHTNTINVWVR